ncbi:MAG: hypothetical protein Q9214_002858 [Letrouitia sp. 1 TL-2023]
MLARQAFKTVQPLTQNIRLYATDGGVRQRRPWGKYGAYGFGGIFTFWVVLRGIAVYQMGPDAVLSPAQKAAKRKEEAAGKADSSDKASNIVFKGGDQGFVALKLESVEQINHNTKKFRFAFPNPDDVSGLHTTSALVTKYQGPEMDKPVIRPYTPTSPDDVKGYMDFVIKKYENGPMSTHIHNMEPPQRLEFKGPISKYPWSPNKHETITLIAGGTGITPNPEDKTKVNLIYGNIAEEDILLKQEFQHLENMYPQRFRAFYMLDKPSDAWTQGTGHVNKEILKTVLPEPKEKDFKIFVCGPPGMYKAVSGMKKSPAEQGELSGMLKEMGYSEDQVYKF